MRKEYQAIADETYNELSKGVYDTRFILERVAERCQALADKPPRDQTDDEKYQLWISLFEGKFASSVCASGSEVVDKIIAAHIAKQKEPETRKVKIYIYHSKDEGFHCFSGPHHGIPNYWKLIDSFEREVTL